MANASIHSYEESISKLQTLEATKDEALIARLQEVAELKAALVKETAAKEAAAQTLSEETVRLQSQLEAVTEEKNRLRIALETRRANLESTQTLIQEGEAKIEHWKVGLENSYQQKRILKQSMRQLMEEDAALREQMMQQRRARQALERDLMHREDVGSVENTQNEEDHASAEFGNLDWARRVFADSPASTLVVSLYRAQSPQVGRVQRKCPRDAGRSGSSGDSEHNRNAGVAGRRAATLTELAGFLRARRPAAEPEQLLALAGDSGNHVRCRRGRGVPCRCLMRS